MAIEGQSNKPATDLGASPETESVHAYAPSEEASDLIEYRQDGRVKATTHTFYRGPHSHFHPTDESLLTDDAVEEYLFQGWTPSRPLVTRSTPVVAFGSCFAANISRHLDSRGYNVLSQRNSEAYVATMGDGLVNTYALRQQFEWAWQARQPAVDLWHGYDAQAFGYNEGVRAATRTLFDAADVFILTLGLAEVWYDEPTSEVFWRAVPYDKHDPARHKFRVSSVRENLANLLAIHRMIREHRPGAVLVVTLSPVPLTATFRDVSCITANAVSKSILRVAIDEFFSALSPSDGEAYYFPSYEVVTGLFQNAFMEDRKHPHHHVLEFNMKAFEHFFCEGDVTKTDLQAAFRDALELDRRVGVEGHFAVHRSMTPRAGGAPRPR